jgi:glyoxylate reductase
LAVGRRSIGDDTSTAITRAPRSERRTLAGGAMMSKPTVVVVCPLPEAGLELLQRRFAVERAGNPAGPDWLREHTRRAAAVVTDPSMRVDGGFLDAAGEGLKVVSNFGVGYDNIDIEAARARGVRVTNTPGVLSNATAELAVALMLSAGRRIAEADTLVRRGQWTGAEEEELLGRELAGATVGLVGFGRIARRVAALLSGFDVRLSATSRSDIPEVPGVERRELLDLLAASDFVSVHVPLTTETRHLIDARAFATMKRGAVFVNTSRGGVVDTSAMIDALRSGHLGAAGLDVYEDEPDVPQALRDLPNTVLLPHVGSATATTRNAMARLCAENVIAVLDGREPPTPVA